MWDRSYRWQGRVRLAAGIVLILALCAVSIALSGTAPAQRAGGGARDLLAELRSSGQDLVSVDVPADLNALPGTLVYLERPDGAAQIIGRVATLEAGNGGQVHLRIRVTAPSAGSTERGVVKGAPPTPNLRNAMRLLISPDTPNDEAALARDMIWPSVRNNVLPDLVDGMIREISTELAHLDPRDQALLQRFVEQLHKALEPLEDQMVDRLANRTWDVIGVQGLASGIWRSAANDLQNQAMGVAGWWSRLFGREFKADPATRPFLSDKTSRELKAALEEEMLEFWNDNRSRIIDAIMTVVSVERQDLETALRERWEKLVFDRAVVPAWLAGQDKVIESVQAYVSDFAARRLFTSSGGPRLLFAYVLRCYLGISDTPLLIFAPATDARSHRVVYEPLLR